MAFQKLLCLIHIVQFCFIISQLQRSQALQLPAGFVLLQVRLRNCDIAIKIAPCESGFTLDTFHRSRCLHLCRLLNSASSRLQCTKLFGRKRKTLDYWNDSMCRLNTCPPGMQSRTSKFRFYATAASAFSALLTGHRCTVEKRSLRRGHCDCMRLASPQCRHVLRGNAKCTSLEQDGALGCVKYLKKNGFMLM